MKLGDILVIVGEEASSWIPVVQFEKIRNATNQTELDIQKRYAPKQFTKAVDYETYAH